MTQIKKILLSFSFFFVLILSTLSLQTVPAKGSDSLAFIILSDYRATVDVGNEFYLVALTSNGNLPTWKSNNSKIVSVNTYGKVTAKKSGTATITAKIKNAEASCKITVNKTRITLSQTSASIEHNETLHLSATTSNHSVVSWKSSKKSIATVDDNGNVTGMKPGETTITATADGNSITCKLTVKSPKVKLNKTKITLLRGQTIQLSATVSSGITPTWKTNKTSVAIVDETGTITAIKHGTAMITATVDKISRCCEVVVEKPVITLSQNELTLKTGASTTITASVSSNNPAEWSSSNDTVALVDSSGTILALQKGRAYIYASEDGAKVRCVVYVTE